MHPAVSGAESHRYTVRNISAKLFNPDETRWPNSNSFCIGFYMKKAHEEMVKTFKFSLPACQAQTNQNIQNVARNASRIVA